MGKKCTQSQQQELGRRREWHGKKSSKHEKGKRREGEGEGKGEGRGWEGKEKGMKRGREGEGKGKGREKASDVSVRGFGLRQGSRGREMKRKRARVPFILSFFF